MLKKITCIICLFTCLAGCSNQAFVDTTTDKSVLGTNTDNSQNETTALQETNESDEEKKLDITYNDYYSNYSGYIDRVAMFDTTYDDCDYDGDGLKDRIYKTVLNENGEAKSSYRIDFGNGNTLEIGNFNDLFTGIVIIGYDITGDGVNEIIFCGEHTASTFPASGSEIAVYTKKDSSYEMLSLPKPDDWKESEKYKVGYSIYIKSMKDNEVTIHVPNLNYENTITIDGSEALTYFKEIGNEPIGGQAWKVSVLDDNGTPSLVLSIDIGYKYYNKDLVVSLSWQDGTLKPMKTKLG